LKNCVAIRRSIASIMLAVAMNGIATSTMNDMMTMDHTNSGTRFSDIPGARCLKTVAMISIAATMAAISVNVIICAQMSTRLPGENSGPASGG
jgi:hypothetical protein